MKTGLEIATNLLKPLETSSSLGMFVRDTGGCLISRLGLSRSKDEAREISIAEISESALFYFSAPALARCFANIFSKKYGINKDQLTSNIKDLKDIPKDSLKNIKLGKFAQIMTTFSLVLPMVFAIAPVRNNITLSKTGKDEFTSVVGLDNKKKLENNSEKSKNKNLNLLKKLGIASLSAIGLTAGVLGLSKKPDIYKKIEPSIDKIIKHFDFTKTGDLEIKHYGALIYPVSIASYFYASRDKYEVMENARRFSITVPLLFFGEKLIQNPIYSYFSKKFNTNIIDKEGIKSYNDIFKLSGNEKISALKAKNCAYGLTFFLNTMAIAAAVALLNRIKTKRNYEKEHKTNNNFQFIKPDINKFILNTKNI